MGLKNAIESSPALIIIGAILTGFVGGVSAMTFLEAREKDLREDILRELKKENTALKVNNEVLDKSVRKILVQYVDVKAVAKGKPLGGANSVVLKIHNEILMADKEKIVKIANNPASWTGSRLGL